MSVKIKCEACGKRNAQTVVTFTNARGTQSTTAEVCNKCAATCTEAT